jgi:hypothetical protein
MSNFVYHYTDANAIASIVKFKSLWATDSNYLNDRNECKIIRNIITNIVEGYYPDISLDEYEKTALRHFLNSDAKAYMVSFSKRKDNLPIYRTYCPTNGGYCIGFTEEFLSSLSNLHYVHCIYCDKEQIEWAKGFVSRFLSNLKIVKSKYDTPQLASNQILKESTLFGELIHASIKFKSSEFSSEEEARLFATRTNEFAINTRASWGGNLLIPYASISLPNVKTPVFLGYGPNTQELLACNGIQELARIEILNGCNWNISAGPMIDTGFRNL